MDEVNSPRAESLHNWTPNSRWFLFTSRRDDGLFTRVYFASIDANGKATKQGEIDWTKTEVSREEAYSINLVDEFHGGCGMKEQED